MTAHETCIADVTITCLRVTVKLLESDTSKHPSGMNGHNTATTSMHDEEDPGEKMAPWSPSRTSRRRGLYIDN